MKFHCPNCSEVIYVETRSDKYFMPVDQKETCSMCDADLFITPNGVYTLEQYINEA